MIQTLSADFERTLRAALPNGARAADVMALSDFYLANPGAHTPWAKPFAEGAYLSYFLPLNYARVRAALREVRRFLPVDPTDTIENVVDYGSGVGTVQWALEDEAWFTPRSFTCVERSREAVHLHRRLAAIRGGRWTPDFETPRRIAPRTLGIFSYAFLEMQSALPDLAAFDHLLIIEPSTRDCGRQLMEWRGRLIKKGFNPLAPCTHAAECPLLGQSPRDWCHTRIQFDAPAWWREFEAGLPMTNRTLTFSYLLMSRTVEDRRWRGQSRVIGDTLPERGKTRQMICRGPAREFLSWLHRDGEPPSIPHGALVRGLENAPVKGGGEVRVTGDVHLNIED